VHLEAARLEALTAWIDRYRLLAEQRFRSLDAVLERTASEPGATHTQQDTQQDTDKEQQS
jgi:hypothetical protein